MVILDNNSKRYVEFPKTFSFNYDMYDLYVKSEVTNKEYAFKNNLNTSQSPLYYGFIVDFSELEDKSEYRYKIQYHNFILEEGLIRIGDYKDNKKHYEDISEYQEYRAD